MDMDDIHAAMEADRELARVRSHYTVALINYFRSAQGDLAGLVRAERMRFEDNVVVALFNYAYNKGEADAEGES